MFPDINSLLQEFRKPGRFAYISVGLMDSELVRSEFSDIERETIETLQRSYKGSYIYPINSPIRLIIDEGYLTQYECSEYHTICNVVAHFDFCSFFTLLVLLCCLNQFGFCVFINLASPAIHFLLLFCSFVASHNLSIPSDSCGTI